MYGDSDSVDKSCIRGTDASVTTTCDGEEKENLVCVRAHVCPKYENQTRREQNEGKEKPNRQEV